MRRVLGVERTVPTVAAAAAFVLFIICVWAYLRPVPLTPTLMLETMRGHGLACRLLPGGLTEENAPYAHGRSTIACTTSGETLSVSTFPNEAALEQNLSSSLPLPPKAEATEHALGLTSFLVIGENWYVTAPSYELARRVQVRLGGRLKCALDADPRTKVVGLSNIADSASARCCPRTSSVIPCCNRSIPGRTKRRGRALQRAILHVLDEGLIGTPGIAEDD